MKRKVLVKQSFAGFLVCALAVVGFSCNEGTQQEETSPKALTQETGDVQKGEKPCHCGPPPHRRPPQEAFDACNNLSEGAECSVEIHGHTIEGTCRRGPDGQGELACAPAGGPPPPPPLRMPPQEAFDACNNLSAGAECSVEIHGHTIEGTCRRGPDGQGELACAPAGGPPPPPPLRRPPQEAFDACNNLSEGAECSVEIHGHTIEGTCRRGPDGQGELACAPAGGPPPPPPCHCP